MSNEKDLKELIEQNKALLQELKYKNEVNEHLCASIDAKLDNKKVSVELQVYRVVIPVTVGIIVFLEFLKKIL